MADKELQGWLEMFVGIGICLYTANRGRHGIFTNLANRGETLVGMMLIAIGIQTHLERLNAETPFFRLLPLGLGILGLALIVAGRLGGARASAEDEAEDRSRSTFGPTPQGPQLTSTRADRLDARSSERTTAPSGP
jgi:hypothetical protein